MTAIATTDQSNLHMSKQNVKKITDISRFFSKITHRKNNPSPRAEHSVSRSNLLLRKIKLWFQSIMWIFPYIAIGVGIGVVGILVNHYIRFKYTPVVPQKKVEFVIGINVDVPIYPGSIFAFDDKMTDPVVQEMFADSMSCYVLPDNQTFEEIKEEYSEILLQYGWSMIGEAGYNSDDKENGLYFINADNSIGLRIYTVSNDVWYEKISVEEAKSMLKYRRELKAKIKNMIQSLQGDTVPEKYGIDLRYSFIYEIKNVAVADMYYGGFSLESSDERITVAPFRWKSNIKLEEAIPLYLSEFMAGKSETYTISETHTETLNSIDFTISTVMIGEKSFYVASFLHTGRNIIYIVSGLECGNVLFRYVIESAKLI